MPLGDIGIDRGSAKKSQAHYMGVRLPKTQGRAVLFMVKKRLCIVKDQKVLAYATPKVKVPMDVWKQFLKVFNKKTPRVDDPNFRPDLSMDFFRMNGNIDECSSPISISTEDTEE